MSTIGLLGVVFIALKLMGVIAWSWWFVLMPFYAVIAIMAAVYIMACVAAMLCLLIGVTLKLFRR